MVFLLFKTILVGIGATVIMDIWALILKQINIRSLDYRLLGRWVGNFPKGKFRHNKILDTPPVRNELVIGWITHYLIGISFSFVLVGLYGAQWLEQPKVIPAILIGLITLVAPFFIMQPAFGFGIAASNLPNPYRSRFKSILTHLVYGLGLYLSIELLNLILG